MTDLCAPDPFTTLTAAAGISARVRLRTYVLNVGFCNPALLARVAATTDLLSQGRLEVGRPLSCSVAHEL